MPVVAPTAAPPTTGTCAPPRVFTRRGVGATYAARPCAPSCGAAPPLPCCCASLFVWRCMLSSLHTKTLFTAHRPHHTDDKPRSAARHFRKKGRSRTLKPSSLAGCLTRARFTPRLRDGLQPPRNRAKPHVGTVLPTQVTSDFNVGKEARQPTDQPKSPAPRCSPRGFLSLFLGVHGVPPVSLTSPGFCPHLQGYTKFGVDKTPQGAPRTRARQPPEDTGIKQSR